MSVDKQQSLFWWRNKTFEKCVFSFGFVRTFTKNLSKQCFWHLTQKKKPKKKQTVCTKTKPYLLHLRSPIDTAVMSLCHLRAKPSFVKKRHLIRALCHFCNSRGRLDNLPNFQPQMGTVCTCSQKNNKKMPLRKKLKKMPM